ncbi:MAG: tripartite tricarboxylate transporter substrate binding protein [Usitatibacter sp.]
MRSIRIAAAILALSAGTVVFAQQYPTKPVKIIVAFTPGSATDILARLTADWMARSLGQPFIVENRAGAGGIIGTQVAKDAPPDGYTLTACPSGPFGINPGIYSHLPYDPVKDFEPISNIGLTPQVIVVGSQFKYKTLKEFVDDAKAHPGDIAYGSLGTGSTSHLTMEAFQSAAGIKLNHIPFKGGQEAQASILGGSFPVMSDTVPGVLAQVKGGKLRGLGVAIPKRSPFLPDVPTIAEQGYPGFESVGWIGLCAPAKTPAAILDKLNAEVQKMLASPEVKEKFEKLAFTAAGDSRAHFAAWIKAEIVKWSAIAKASGAKAD